MVRRRSTVRFRKGALIWLLTWAFSDSAVLVRSELDQIRCSEMVHLAGSCGGADL